MAATRAAKELMMLSGTMRMGNVPDSYAHGSGKQSQNIKRSN